MNASKVFKNDMFRAEENTFIAHFRVAIVGQNHGKC